MTSFGLIRTGTTYQKRYNAFIAKTGERMKMFEILRDHLPPIIRRILPLSNIRSRFNILSVGGGTGEMDMEIMKIIKDESLKSEQSRFMKLFNRAIEPNEYSCGLYKAAIENLPSPLNNQLTEFDLRQQTFEEYKQSQKVSVKFDMVHFIHSIYYVDIEQALTHCVEKELSDKGFFACIVEERDLSYWVTVKQSNQWHGKDKGGEIYETTDKIIKIANDNGWKHEIYTQEYSIDVTEVFDEKSTEGNLLLDFLTHTVNFRETADKQLVEETLALIKDLTTVKDGKRLGDKKESLLLIYK
ncbi:histamine N-methyltransferase-like isoform X1 [Oculina patagonica]